MEIVHKSHHTVLQDGNNSVQPQGPLRSHRGIRLKTVLYGIVVTASRCHCWLKVSSVSKAPILPQLSHVSESLGLPIPTHHTSLSLNTLFYVTLLTVHASRAGVGPLFSPGSSDPRPAHFLCTKQGWMQPALTGGAVNLSGGYHNYRKGSSFLYWSHFWDCLTMLVLIRPERCKHSGLNCITVNASARCARAKFSGHYLSTK